jgi:menaquinone-dependent protoporphyrinogen IX oxidase
MKIEYLHASKYGNGAAVAAEFEQQMAAKGVAVDVHHIREVRPTELAPTDVCSAPLDVSASRSAGCAAS